MRSGAGIALFLDLTQVVLVLLRWLHFGSFLAIEFSIYAKKESKRSGAERKVSNYRPCTSDCIVKSQSFCQLIHKCMELEEYSWILG
jgi:hypothetical protein